ncbi:hypothetical protein [Bacillus marasmi]|uniref:hypothetical protein n=1 Tax=Bacillus marasmi TaxID=1926279 RepID=UPI0011C80C57|nr:hypothetical protein [Bacillus marasmi]
MDRTSKVSFILSNMKGLPQLETEIKEIAELLKKGRITLRQLSETPEDIRQVIVDAFEIYQDLYGQRPKEKDSALNNWQKAELEGKIYWIDKDKRHLYYDSS